MPSIYSSSSPVKKTGEGWWVKQFYIQLSWRHPTPCSPPLPQCGAYVQVIFINIPSLQCPLQKKPLPPVPPRFHIIRLEKTTTTLDPSSTTSSVNKKLKLPCPFALCYIMGNNKQEQSKKTNTKSNKVGVISPNILHWTSVLFPWIINGKGSSSSFSR